MDTILKDKKNTEFKSLNDWINEEFGKIPLTFNDIFRIKNKWVPVPRLERETLAQKFFELVDLAYEPVGGHLKVETPNDMLRHDWDIWYAEDIDNDPDADVVIFGKRTQFGVKLIGAGHDGSRKARREAMLRRGHFLLGKGAYVEASNQPYNILTNKYNIDIIKDPKVVQAVLNKPIQWLGEHPQGKSGDPYGNPYWYSRIIGNKKVSKILMGNPILSNL